MKVIEGCAASAEGRRSTWITPALLLAYLDLHQRGHAHSVEVWRGQALIGGLYGVASGGLFAGESMFSSESNGSKVALFYLVARLRERGYALLDTQTSTPHLLRMGVREIPRAAYLERLAAALRLNCRFD